MKRWGPMILTTLCAGIWVVMNSAPDRVNVGLLTAAWILATFWLVAELSDQPILAGLTAITLALWFQPIRLDWVALMPALGCFVIVGWLRSRSFGLPLLAVLVAGNGLFELSGEVFWDSGLSLSLITFESQLLGLISVLALAAAARGFQLYGPFGIMREARATDIPARKSSRVRNGRRRESFLWLGMSLLAIGCLFSSTSLLFITLMTASMMPLILAHYLQHYSKGLFYFWSFATYFLVYSPISRWVRSGPLDLSQLPWVLQIPGAGFSLETLSRVDLQALGVSESASNFLIGTCLVANLVVLAMSMEDRVFAFILAGFVVSGLVGFFALPTGSVYVAYPVLVFRSLLAASLLVWAGRLLYRACCPRPRQAPPRKLELQAA